MTEERSVTKKTLIKSSLIHFIVMGKIVEKNNYNEGNQNTIWQFTKYNSLSAKRIAATIKEIQFEDMNI